MPAYPEPIREGDSPTFIHVTPSSARSRGGYGGRADGRPMRVRSMKNQADTLRSHGDERMKKLPRGDGDRAAD